MSSPIPPDPYLALGVAKDSDISAIRTSHRKLVLKLHPDRIKDEAEKLRGKDEFQKVQQAYELLSDPDRRSRYDDRVKLAALRKEAMTRESPMRSASSNYAMPMRPAPPSSSHSRRDFRAEGIYEERRPEDYFGSRESFTSSSRDRFDDEPPRSSSRKYDVPSERERRNSTKTSESSKAKKSAWDTGAAGISVKMGLKLQAKAKQVRDRTSEKREQEKREKELDKEKKATRQKLRDQEQRRDRSDKAHRRVYVEDDSSSDSDTATQVTDATIRGARVETVRPSSKSSPRSGMRPEESRRSSERSRRYADDDDDNEYADIWEERHKGAADYITSSGHRPTMGRDDSNYWQDRSRISGSDSDRRPTSSKGRRADDDGANTRPPAMPTQKSSPASLRNHLEERVPQRSASGSSVLPDRERERRAEPPSFTRSKTMPTSRSASKKDSAPAKGSNLKHTETHDSGYGSSSSPHTPELGGTSPTRDSREFRRDTPRQAPSTSKTKYQIVEPAEDDDYSRPILNRTPTVILEDEDRHRRFQSSPERRSDKPERPRIVPSDRTKSSRVSSSKVDSSSARPQEVRRDSGRRSARASPPISRHNSGRTGGSLFGAIDDDEPSSYVHQPGSPKHDSYGRRDSREERDYMPTPRHRENMFSSRRPSVDVR
jgi:curved DNA-binding protein CbpA